MVLSRRMQRCRRGNEFSATFQTRQRAYSVLLVFWAKRDSQETTSRPSFVWRNSLPAHLIALWGHQHRLLNVGTWLLENLFFIILILYSTKVNMSLSWEGEWLSQVKVLRINARKLIYLLDLILLAQTLVIIRWNAQNLIKVVKIQKKKTPEYSTDN